MSNQPELDFEFYLPAGRESFRVWEVAAMLRHSNDQILKLIDLGKFGKVLECSTGRKSSQTIPRAGVVKFLRENSK
jgi:hypothetical protein